jgi:hypothetical protein
MLTRQSDWQGTAPKRSGYSPSDKRPVYPYVPGTARQCLRVQEIGGWTDLSESVFDGI